MSSKIGEIIEGKVIPRSYGHISHLTGSKMIDKEDKLIGVNEEAWMTQWRKSFEDLVIITEKVDGCNVGVLKMHGKLYPIQKKGYDVRTSSFEWLRGFSYFLECNENRFDRLLKEGERACGEWMIKTHTLTYNLKTEPFILFDIIEGEKRVKYNEMIRRSKEFGFTNPGLVHMGEAMPTEIAMKIMGIGYHGVVGFEPEGIVYRYETPDHFVCSAKFVANRKLGKEETFQGNDDTAYNILKSKYRNYQYMNPALQK